MESVEFWGIVFRSHSHMIWFQGSVVAFGVGLVWYLATSIVAEIWGERNDFIPLRTALWRFLALSHIVTSFNAIIAIGIRFISGRAINDAVYSVDCIWFNAIFAAVYFSLYKIVTMLENRKLNAKTAR